MLDNDVGTLLTSMVKENIKRAYPSGFTSLLKQSICIRLLDYPLSECTQCTRQAFFLYDGAKTG